jgi:ribosome biogenesis GTPase
MQIAPNAIDPLRRIGWPADDAALDALDGLPDGRIARVSGQHRSGYIVAIAPGVEFPVQSPSPWVRRQFPPEQRAVVGDWVLLEPTTDQIVQLLPRRSLLKRAAAGEHYKQQLIAANIDHALVVSGLDQDFNPRRIERYVLLVRGSGAEPVLVLTKADLVARSGQHGSPGGDIETALAALTDIRAQGIAIFVVNAKDAASIQVLRPYLGPGHTVVLVGSSGAGKSTLSNTLLGREKMKTAAVREADARGRHTTTHRALIPLPQGGCLIDTPGMRELKPSGEEDLAEGGFEDIEALAAQCRFRDCAHVGEPGCAVRAALDAGTLDPARYANYLKLSGEVSVAAQGMAAQQARRAEPRAAVKSVRKRSHNDGGDNDRD